jgi:hypothetical protein
MSPLNWQGLMNTPMPSATERRRRAGEAAHENWMIGLPIWVRTVVALSRAIAYIGVPSTISIFLVYVGADVLRNLPLQVESTKAAVLQNQTLLQELIRQGDRQLLVLRNNCANGAKDEIARKRCFENPKDDTEGRH